MTDPKERELIEHARKLRTDLCEALPNGVGNTIDALADALQSRIAEVGRLEEALGNTLDLIDELYRRHGVELEPDEVAVAQNARAALSLQRRV